MPRYNIVVDVPDELVKLIESGAAILPPGLIQAAPVNPPPAPPREPGDDPLEPEHRAPATARANGQAEARRRMSGNELLGWIGDQPDAQDLLKLAQKLGKSRGYGWQIKTWTHDQVADVYHELTKGRIGIKR